MVFIHDFFYCGFVGLLMEVLFTGFHSARRRISTLEAKTSLTMFPIYGMAALVRPVSKVLQKFPTLIRGLFYMSMIFSAEFVSGTLLKKTKRCPWDYSHSKYHIGSVIRIDYALYWFLAGLFYEAILKKKHAKN